VTARAVARRPHLIGSVAGRLVALELEHVSEVLPMLPVDPVPGGPSGLAGFVGLEGEPVPVFSLRVLFGLERAGADPRQRIVVCASSSRPVGLVVDDVAGLGEVSSCRSPTVEDRIVALEVVKAIGLVADGVCVLLEPRVVVEWLTGFLAGARPSPAPEAGAP
jgi:chemotaxis signal transduction protein